MTLLVDAASWVLLCSGALICVIGGVGLHRMPDFYSRTHAGGLTDTLGASLILLGLVLQAGPTLVSVKLLMVAFLLHCTSPTATHALVKAAYSRGVKVRETDANDVSP